MKKQLTHYLLEVSIIFIGITLGFLVNGWREKIHDAGERREVYASLKTELIRARGFIEETNASTALGVKKITSILVHERVPDPLVLQLFSETVSQFSNDLSGIMNHSLSMVNSNSRLISPNDTLAHSSAYILHIVEDHNKINSSIHEIANHQLWPILEKYSVTLDLNDYQQDVHDNNNLKGDYLSVATDKEIRTILRHIRYKKNEQKVIYDILTAHLDKMIYQLEKETR
jgi:hypothetical protein